MRLLLLALGHEEAGRLGNEWREDEDEDTRKALEDDGQLPREVRVEVVGAESDSCGRDRTTIPLCMR